MLLTMTPQQRALRELQDKESSSFARRVEKYRQQTISVSVPDLLEKVLVTMLDDEDAVPLDVQQAVWARCLTMHVPFVNLRITVQTRVKPPPSAQRTGIDPCVPPKRRVVYFDRTWTPLRVLRYMYLHSGSLNAVFYANHSMPEVQGAMSPCSVTLPLQASRSKNNHSMSVFVSVGRFKIHTDSNGCPTLHWSGIDHQRMVQRVNKHVNDFNRITEFQDHVKFSTLPTKIVGLVSTWRNFPKSLDRQLGAMQGKCVVAQLDIRCSTTTHTPTVSTLYPQIQKVLAPHFISLRHGSTSWLDHNTLGAPARKSSTSKFFE